MTTKAYVSGNVCVNYGTHCTAKQPWNEESPTLRSFSNFLLC